MEIQDRVNKATAFRDAAVEAHRAVADLQTLEVMRLLADEDEERKALDLAILARKRELKADYEGLAFIAEWWEKSAVPLAAAIPVSATLLVGEKLLDGPKRTIVLVTAYIIGGLAWGVCRWAAFRYGHRAKSGAATLGKVD